MADLGPPLTRKGQTPGGISAIGSSEVPTSEKINEQNTEPFPVFRPIGIQCLARQSFESKVSTRAPQKDSFRRMDSREALIG